MMMTTLNLRVHRSHCRPVLKVKVRVFESSSLLSLNQRIFTRLSFYSTNTESREFQLPPRPSRTEPLAGKVPYHTSYLFLHTHQPPESWPKTLNSPFYLQLKEILAKYNGLVNVSWSPSQTITSSGSESRESEALYPGGTFWIRRSDEHPCEGIVLPSITPHTLSIFDDIALGHIRNTRLASADDGNSTEEAQPELAVTSAAFRTVKLHAAEHLPRGLYFYICCHGHRDCRCGVRGGALADALTSELEKRNMLLDEQGRPRLGRVGHVGGHKNAPNLIIFPHGDWFGNLQADDLPSLVNHYVQSLQTMSGPSPSSPSSSSSSFSLYSTPNRFQWRGRMGMTKETQRATWDKSIIGY